MGLGEAGDGERHDRRGRRLEGGEAQAAAAQPGQGFQLGLGLGELGEDGVRVADHRRAGLRQPHAARGALDEDRAGLPLERRDLLRHGGLGEGQRLCRSGERAALGDLPEHAHAADVEHQ